MSNQQKNPSHGKAYINTFINGTLENYKVMVRNTDQVIRRFRFQVAGKRPIAQIKQLLLALDMRMD